MKINTRFIVQSGTIAALYVVLSHLQNLIPGNFTWGPIQFRISEALCVLAFFSPTAIWGLSVGCGVFNLTYGAALPFDFLVGSFASALAAICMWKGRNCTYKGYPLPAMLMPALFNGILVGAELTLTAGIGGSFWLNATMVALGEAGVLLTLGTALFYAIKLRKLEQRIF